MSRYLQGEGVDVAKQRQAFDQIKQLEAKYGELATDAALAAGGELPPPFGTAVDIFSLGRSLWKADWGGALLDLAGFIPLVGAAGKGGKIIKRLDDLRRAIDVGKDALRRSMMSTRQAAAKYWRAIADKNFRAYADAVKSCGTNKACREAKAILKGPQYKNAPVSGPKGQWQGDRGDSVWVPADGKNPVRYSGGFPDYTPYSKANVDIPMQGNHTTDFTKATEAAEPQLRKMYGDNWRTGWRRDYTWHHNQNGTTMQLVPKNIHATGGGASTPHMGGNSMYSGGNYAEF